MTIKEVKPKGVFKSPAAPFSLAVRSEGGALLHISGQVPQDAAGVNVGPGDVRAQAEQVIQNIKAIVEAEGGSLADVCRLTIYLTAREYLPTVMEVRRKYFKDPFPAATAVVVSGLANVDWLVEIEATAAIH
ncbi:RidA family protein [Roseixanthobacter pseudopolyaromaticivorans]|uniref:RidA family protein n=1 Tax=Xanthobacteraceae TaxID=335928 RepID=UPI0037262249